MVERMRPIDETDGALDVVCACSGHDLMSPQTPVDAGLRMAALEPPEHIETVGISAPRPDNPSTAAPAWTA
jgi:hypothetical protein